MGKLTVLLAILGFGVFAMRQTGSTSRTLFGVQSSATDDAAEVVARSSALAGFTRAEQALTESFEDVTLSGSFEGGTYITTATVVGQEARVTSRGILDRAFAAPDTFEIHALVTPAMDPEELPDALKYGMLVGGNLSISGSSEIVTMGFTDPDGAYNPLIHVNGDLKIGSSSTRVSGFGSYSGALTGKSPTGIFTPPYNPDGLPPLEKKDPVDIPPFDAQALVDAYGTPTLDVPDGPDFWDNVIDKTPSTLVGGTRDNPAVYRFRGNTELANITVDGYVIFVVDGITNTGGYIRAINGDPRYPNESQVAIYSGGEVRASGGAEIHAQIMAGGGLSFRGNVDIHGSLLTYEDFSNGGGATMHIKPASPALARPWQEGTAGVLVLAYTEYGLGTSRKQ